MSGASSSVAVASSTRTMERVKDFARAGAVGAQGLMRWASRFQKKCLRARGATSVAGDGLAAGLEIGCCLGCRPAAAWSWGR